MNKVLMTVAALSLVVISCKKDSSDPTSPEGGGNTPALGQATCTVDSRAFAGPTVAGVDVDGITITALVVAGTDTATLYVFVSTTNPALNSSISLGDASSGSPGEGGIVFGFSGDPTTQYFTGVNGTTGTVTLTARSASAVAGTASFTASNGSANKSVANFAFNAPISN